MNFEFFYSLNFLQNLMNFVLFLTAEEVNFAEKTQTIKYATYE